MRRTKIVCTLGPASSTEAQVAALAEAGMDVARLNFSHGTHPSHRAAIAAVRAVSERIRKPIAILGDLCGPKIRLGTMPGGTGMLETGTAVTVRAGTSCEAGALAVRFPTLARDVRAGDRIHLDDGRITLRVERVDGDDVRCLVEEGGPVRDNVGVHLPSDHLQLAALTEKDKEDLLFCLGAGVDYVALSFVRHPDDVKQVREICEAWGRSLPVVAKIETPQAIENLTRIVEVSDAVMVARGDLGVEFPPEEVPVLQRTVVRAALAGRKPVIVATEMLQSMVKSTRPTRAEASDVATAVLDGADATMLSQESASGDHPALAVRMMARIIQAAEDSAFHVLRSPPALPAPAPFPEATARMAVLAARDVGARLIAVFTQGGESARLVASQRPDVPVVAFSPNEDIRRRLALYWGTVPRVLVPVSDADSMVELVEQHLLSAGMIGPGDALVVVWGAPITVRGSTNSVRVVQVQR